MNIVIKPMKECHLQGVVAIENASFLDQAWSKSSFEQELKNPHAFYVVALDSTADNIVVGFGGMHHILDEGHILNIAVDVSFRGRGIGTCLMQAFLEFAHEKGLSFLMLEVRESNHHALSLYERHGFKQISTRESYYKNPMEDAVIMFLGL
ncbi:MAG: ribosomal protein S18-alanine N-acetyltransferase [Defluviitaleaceae bacterium]|nr:ribosomal protein S18-alanine N-acetyltransferase [Defluviitaleaceae bacterium]